MRRQPPIGAADLGCAFDRHQAAWRYRQNHRAAAPRLGAEAPDQTAIAYQIFSRQSRACAANEGSSWADGALAVARHQA